MDKNRERLFGTDGIRGTPGIYPLSDGMIFKIGRSVSKFLYYKRKDERKQLRVVIGKDTRLTGERIETLLTNAFTSYGIDVLLAGTISTAGLAYLVDELNADTGIMISASHNKPSDNGIKFFNAGGYKLLKEDEEWIEDIIFTTLINTPNGITVKRKGRVIPVKNSQQKYVKFLLSTVKGLRLNGIKVAVDCAWGATCGFAGQIFEKLGAEVVAINDTPSGENINEGGAVDPSLLKSVVKETGAGIGVALDGDGDRGIIVDDKGNVLDGDYILAIVARHLIQHKKLPQNTIVTTVMSNLGLKISLAEVDGKIIYTKVGDKYVLESLMKNGLNIGGEQSGHIIFLDYLPTPDGLLNALQILKVMGQAQKPLSQLAACMTKYPQILINIPVKEKVPFETLPQVAEKLDYFNSLLQEEGRILLRYSGTELLARVMVEGKNKELIEDIARIIANEIKKEIGLEEVRDVVEEGSA
ncbi:MAG: phosphoglucosamine mutase [Candidatus Omnitrophica bacterium]|nr:phosphoglucosamine mutase [Candidatus Omnitrophota bacterium]